MRRPILTMILISSLLLGLYAFSRVYPGSSKVVREMGEKSVDPPSVTDKNRRYNIVEQLTTEVQITYFKKLLGDPIFINPARGELKEYVWVDQLFYVQAIANEDGKVLSYAVTTRDKDFNPEFYGSEGGKLGITTLSEFERSDVCYGQAGAHPPYYYFEQYYLGRPGMYRYYLYGYSNAGYLQDGTVAEIDSLFGLSPPKPEAIPGTFHTVLSEVEVGCNAITSTLRSKPINTYVVVSADASDEPGRRLFGIGTLGAGTIIGVNSDQVGLLNED